MGGLRDGMGGGSGDPLIKNEFFDGVRLVDDAKLYFRDTGIYIHSDADGSILISSDGSSGRTVKISLGEKAGLTSVAILDSDGFPINTMDSSGNISHKGKLQRTTTN